MVSPDNELRHLSGDEEALRQELLASFTELISSISDDAEKVTMTRQFIHLLVGLHPDFVDGFLSIKIVERESGEKKDCFTYLFGVGRDAQAVTDEITETYQPSRVPISGSYAIYLTDDLKPRHIGIVTDKGTIISKWGPNAHVYEHLPLLVPSSYGSRIGFFKPAEA